MGWSKSAKEYVWKDAVTDLINDKVIISMIKNLVAAVASGYRNDGNDLKRLVGFIRPLVSIYRTDFAGLKTGDANKVNNVMRFMDDVITGARADDQNNLTLALGFLNELVGASGYTLGTI